MVRHEALSRVGQCLAGTSLLGIALAAGGLGLTLNVQHGIETSLAAGIAFGLADGAKIVVPVVCGIVGWTKQMRLTALVCVLASLWAASNAYLDAAGRELLAKEHGQTVYTDADRRIGELAAEASSLRAMAEAESKRKGCGENCRDLAAKAATAAQRLQEARDARAGLKPTEASGLATIVAMTSGGDADHIARWLGAVKASLFILLVEALVWLAVPAMVLLGLAFGRQPVVIELEPVVAAAPAPMTAPICVPARNVGVRGDKAYYQARLEREHPRLAAAVDRGELSVFAASVMCGMRKPPKERQLLLTHAG